MKIDSQENVLRHFLFGSRKNPYLTFQGKVFGLNLPTPTPPPLPHQGNSSLVSEFPLKDCSFNHFPSPVPPPPPPPHAPSPHIIPGTTHWGKCDTRVYCLLLVTFFQAVLLLGDWNITFLVMTFVCVGFSLQSSGEDHILFYLFHRENLSHP